MCSEQQVWCGTLRYGTSKYSRVNANRADAVSLQVGQCIAEGDMLSAESVGGMSTWTFSDNIPLLSGAEMFEVYVLYVQGGQKKKDLIAWGNCKDKENCCISMMVLALALEVHLSSRMRIFTCAPQYFHSISIFPP